MIWWLVIHPDGTGESVATDPDTLPDGCAAAFPVAHRVPYGRQWRTTGPSRSARRPNVPAQRAVAALARLSPDQVHISGPVLIGTWSDHRRGRRKLAEIAQTCGVTIVHTWHEGSRQLPDTARRLRGQQLTPRELRCTAAVADGLTFAEAAARLGVAQHTVRDDLQRAKAKLGARSTAHLVGLAVVRGLVRPAETTEHAAAV
jgi:DNA-binding CsgD family transcriptional regulator